jgi:SynChlorMet cassette protein ScmC
MPDQKYNKGYSLRLSNNDDWWITSDSENIGLIDRLAFIMNLKEYPSNKSAKIIFAESLDSGISKIYKSNQNIKNWRCLNYSNVRIWQNDSIDDVIYEVKDNQEEIIKYIVLSNSLLPIYLRNIDMKGLSLHSALAEYNGKGILFAAPGGTGKSTCYNRLPDYWKPLCDDETLIVLDQNDTYRAHPFPTWSDYLMKRKENTWDVQYSVPLSAIFFIEQSDHDEIIYIDRRKSTLSITGSAKQILAIFLHGMKKEQKIDISTKMFNNAFDMAKKIPVFRLLVSLNGQFWKEVEKVV